MSAAGDASGAAAWVAKAHSDLAYARTLLAQPALPRWGACFHAQQAAEKAIKALLVAADIDPPKSHNLVMLSGLLPQRRALRAGDEILAGLSRWAVAGRYPSELPDPGADVAGQAVADAAAIVDHVERRLEEAPPDERL